MAKIQNITLDELLGMEIDDYRDTISALSKLELSKVEMLLNEYVKTTSPREVIEYNGALKLNYVKNAKKNKKVLSKVIAKVQEENRQETTSKKPDTTTKPASGKSISDFPIKNSQGMSKNTGINYGYKSGQGDFFGKQSTFKFLKQMADMPKDDRQNPNQQSFSFDTKTKKTRTASQKPTLVKVSIENIQASIIKQLAGNMGSAKNIKSKAKMMSAKGSQPRVKRITKAEQDKINIRRDEVNTRKEHLEELKYKHRADNRLELKKLRHYNKTLDYKSDANKLGLEYRDKIEKQKTRRLNLNNKNKELLLDKANKHKEEIALSKLNAKRDADKEKHEARLQLLKIRREEAHRNSTEKHLHAIHPALGLLYGLSENKKDKSKSDKGDSDSSSLLEMIGAGGTGGLLTRLLGGGSEGGGGGLLKGLAKKTPIIGALISGISTTMSSGSVGKGSAAGVGSLIGGLAGAALMGAIAGTAIGGPVGTIVGAIIGSTLGEIGAKKLYDKIFGSGDSPTSNNIATPPKYKKMNPSDSKEPSYSAHGKIIKDGNYNQSTSADKKFLNTISANEGKTYNTIFGGKEGDLTSKTLQEIMDFQSNPDNFPKDKNGKLISTALGKYQMNANFMKDQVPKSGYDPKTTLFSPEVQDDLIMKNLKSRGLDDFKSGKISKERFGNNTAKLLASLPLLSNDGKRNRGESAYSGIAGNRALMKAGDYSDALDSYFNSTNFQKSPSKSASLSSTTDKIKKQSIDDKTKPINVVNVGGSSTGGTNIVNNTYVNPTNTDSVVRQLSNHMMMPGRPH